MATKGLADLATAEREMRVRKKPNYDAVCVHSQQAVEKLLKAKLVVLRREVPRSHDLAHLLGLVTDRKPSAVCRMPPHQPLATSYTAPPQFSRRGFSVCLLTSHSPPVTARVARRSPLPAPFLSRRKK